MKSMHTCTQRSSHISECVFVVFKQQIYISIVSAKLCKITFFLSLSRLFTVTRIFIIWSSAYQFEAVKRKFIGIGLWNKFRADCMYAKIMIKKLKVYNNNTFYLDIEYRWKPVVSSAWIKEVNRCAWCSQFIDWVFSLSRYLFFGFFYYYYFYIRLLIKLDNYNKHSTTSRIPSFVAYFHIFV